MCVSNVSIETQFGLITGNSIMAISIYTGCVSKGTKRTIYQGFLLAIVVSAVIFLIAPVRSLYLRCIDPQIKPKFDLSVILGSAVYAVLILSLLVFVYLMAKWDYFSKVGSIILFFLLSPKYLFYNFVFFFRKLNLCSNMCVRCCNFNFGNIESLSIQNNRRIGFRVLWYWNSLLFCCVSSTDYQRGIICANK